MTTNLDDITPCLECGNYTINRSGYCEVCMDFLTKVAHTEGVPDPYDVLDWQDEEEEWE